MWKITECACYSYLQIFTILRGGWMSSDNEYLFCWVTLKIENNIIIKIFVFKNVEFMKMRLYEFELYSFTWIWYSNLNNSIKSTNKLINKKCFQPFSCSTKNMFWYYQSESLKIYWFDCISQFGLLILHM